MATIDLADEGLEQGDVIDGYLDDHAGGSDTVIVPEGTYEWHGDGLDTGSGEIVGAGDPGDVVFEHTENTFRGFIAGVLQNIVVRGSNPEAKSGLYPRPGGTIDEFAWPEGGQQSEDRAIYTSDGGDERVTVSNSAWAGCVNNGAYTDKPPCTYQNCAAVNNNIANIRIGHRDGTPDGETTYVTNTLIAVTDEIQSDDTNVPHSRGLRLRHPAHLVVENCWFVFREGFGAADLIELHDGAEGSTVEIRNCHFHNETSRDLVRVKGSESEFDLTVEDCTFSGSGSDNIDHSGYDGNGVTADDNVTVPTPAQVTGIPQANECYGFDGAAPFDPNAEVPEADEPADDGPDTSDWDTFEVISQQEGGMDYEFTVDGRVEMTETSSEVRAGHGDEVAEHDDGTSTVTGSTGNVGFGDAYLVEGAVSGYSQDPADHDADVLLNGDPWDSPDDGTDEDSSDGSEDDSSDDGGSDKPTTRTIEETESGYRMIARTQLMYFGPDNRFVSREDFIEARNEEIRNG